MDYVVVEIGGSQVKVKKGDMIQTDFSLGQSKKSLKISKVLMYHYSKKVELGNPYVKGASINCDVVSEGKAKKVIAYKYKRRKNSKFKKGHRQKLITLRVKDINLE